MYLSAKFPLLLSGSGGRKRGRAEAFRGLGRLIELGNLSMLRNAAFALLAVAMLSISSGASVTRADTTLPVLNVTVFAAPSQSIWIPTLIEQAKLDEKRGFKLTITPKPANIAYQDFATGADEVCYCASVSAVARFVEQGSKVALLWNIFDYDYYIVAAKPAIRSAKDLAGHVLMTDTITGSWAMAKWLLQASGVDLSQVEIQSASTLGATGLAELLAGRVDALAVNPTEASAILVRAKNLHAFTVFDKAVWAKYSKSPALPSIAFAVWQPWLQKPQNVDLARRFYAANLDAAALIRKDPDKAAELVAAGTGIDKNVLQNVFSHYSKLIDIRPISDYREAIAVLTQSLLPKAGLLERGLSDDELKTYVSDFRP
jgi:NitT/TauT family transport system substrate-binding protein